MKQHRNVSILSMWKRAGVVFLIAAATGGALYSMTVRTASTSTGAALSPTPAGAAVKAHVGSMPPGQPGATAQAGATAGAVAPGGSTYFIDPVTRESRAPSPEEIQALLAAGVTTASVAEPEPIVGVNGIPGLRLTDEQMTFSVATRDAHGKVSVEEAEGSTEALQKVRGASAGGTKAGKEQIDVQ